MAREQNLRYEPDYAVPPGETLRETLDSIGMTQSDLALRTGRPTKTVNEIVKGKAAITPETALQFQRVLGVPASFWNNLQRNYEADLARLAERKQLETCVEWLRRGTVREIIKRGWVRSYDDKVQQLREVLAFLRVASPGRWDKHLRSMGASFRLSAARQPDTEALAFWLRKGEIEASRIDYPDYDARGFREALGAIRALTLSEPGDSWPALKARCAQVGVAVVLVRELPKTRVSGATRWIRNRPLIQLSLRYKKDDQIWFSFFHETGHVLLHQRRPVYIDLAGKSREGSEEETEANQFAANALIPPSSFRQFTASRNQFSTQSVLRFAQSIGIAPGIVVGRLQHEGLLPPTHLNGLKRTVNLAE
jgi:HTH-type transcriptional regulator/antitoxin HigA